MAVTCSSITCGVGGAGLGSALTWCALKLCGADSWDDRTWRRIRQKLERSVGLPEPAKKDADGLGSAVKHSDGGLEFQAEVDADLINQLVERQWSYINEWFADTVRGLAEPALGGYAKIAKCHLGETPLRLQPMSTSVYVQDGTGDAKDRTVFRMEARIETGEDGEIAAEICTMPFSGQSIVMSLVVRGTIVIELVKLTKQPPWFSAVRIYFPDAPDVFFMNFKRPAWLETVTTTFKGKPLDALILNVIKDGIQGNAVLPHRFTLELMPIDPMFLKHPRPRGVLRIAGAHCTPCDEAAPTHVEFALGAERNGEPLEIGAEAFVEATKSGAPEAAETNSMASLSVCNFIFSERRGQHVHAMCSGPGQARRGAALLGDVCADQGDGKPSTYLLQLQKNDGIGDFHRLQLVGEWRPFARTRQDIQNVMQDQGKCEWSLGDKHEKSWAVLVDLYYAEGLPGRVDGIQSGTEHWVELTLSCKATWQVTGSENSMRPSCHKVKARTLAEHGQQRLQEALGEHIAMFSDKMGSVSSKEWRKVLRRPEPQVYQHDASKRLDAIWMQSFECLLDKHGGIYESIGTTKLVATVWRADPSARGAEKKSKVGKVVFELFDLLRRYNNADDSEHGGEHEQDVLSRVQLFDLTDNYGQVCGRVKLGVHVLLLLPAKDCRTLTIGDRLRLATQQMTRSTTEVMKRRMTRSFAAGSQVLRTTSVARMMASAPLIEEDDASPRRKWWQIWKPRSGSGGDHPAAADAAAGDAGAIEEAHVAPMPTASAGVRRVEFAERRSTIDTGEAAEDAAGPADAALPPAAADTDLPAELLPEPPHRRRWWWPFGGTASGSGVSPASNATSHSAGPGGLLMCTAPSVRTSIESDGLSVRQCSESFVTVPKSSAGSDGLRQPDLLRYYSADADSAETELPPPGRNSSEMGVTFSSVREF
eukprot:TRINITY_DN7174_c0_g1_i1.p1 TRINITY_DN7174_c0_g1~~TRINITY_DN7174_c0_g1_i1.p1  ORF type:complete len:932 (+),score=174.77 TRINITY_DN7174_c0_g1_i1:82-2877(+)